MTRLRLDPYIVAVVVAAAVAVAPLAQPGFLWGADAFLHLFRTFELVEALADGELLPRWIPSFAFGYGYPLFNFYPPLFYYLAALAHFGGLSWDATMKVAPAASVPVAGVGMYLLTRDLFDKRSGLLAAIAYMYWPYAMLNIYARAAGPESLATALLPWALWALRRGFGSWSWVVAAGVALAAVMLVHNISGLLFTPLFVVYGAFGIAVEPAAGRRSGAVRLAAATALGLGLSAVYWLPAWAELPYTLTGSLGGLDPTFFRYLSEPQNLIQRSLVFYYDDESFWFGRIAAVPAAAAVVSMGALFVLRGARRRQLGFFLALAIAAAAAMTTVAEPLWRAAPAFTFIQFSWRLLTYVGLGVAVGVGALAWLVGVGQRRGGFQTRPYSTVRALVGRWAILLVVAPLLVATALLGVRPRYVDSDVASRPYAARYEQVGRIVGTTVPAQFLPTTVSDVALLGRPRAEVWPDAEVGPSPQIELLTHDGRRVALRTRADAPFRLRLHALEFPGWTATIDGATMPVVADGPLGLVAVEVPAGDHDVAVFFGDTPPRRLGLAISALAALAGLLIIGGMAVGAGFKPAPTRRSPPHRWAAALGAVLALLAIGVGLLLALGSRSGAMTPAALDYAVPASGVGERLRLIGWRAEQVGPSGEGLRVSLVWHVRGDGGDLADVLRLTDADGRVVATQTKAPRYGESPASWWRRNEIVLDEQELWLPPGTPAGAYRLELGVRPVDASAAVGLATLGAVVLQGRAAVPPPPMTPVGAVLGGQVELVGYRVEGGAAGVVRRAAPGDALDVTLFWRALVDMDVDYAVFVHLHDAAERNIAAQDSNPEEGEDLRLTSVMPVGRVVEHRYRLAIPADAAPGVYYLSTGMYRRQTLARLPLVEAGTPTARNRIVLEPVKVPLSSASGGTPPQVALDAAFENGITLVGADVAATVLPGEGRPGDALNVVLQWRADTRVSRDYTAFLHLTDLSGRVVAQHDARPRGGAYPTWAWDVGEVVADPHGLVVPPNLPPGDYLLKAGLYTWPDPSQEGRARLVAGGDQIVVATVRVAEGPPRREARS